MVQASSQNGVNPGKRKTDEAEELLTACSQDLTPRQSHRTRSLGLQSPGFLPTMASRPVFIQNHYQPSYSREAGEGGREGHVLAIWGTTEIETSPPAAQLSPQLDSADMILASVVCQALGTSWTA